VLSIFSLVSKVFPSKINRDLEADNHRQQALLEQLKEAHDLRSQQLILDEMMSVDLLHSADLSNIALYDIHLESADLDDVNLSCATLLEADLEGASLQYAHLSEANLRGAHLNDANLSGADISHTFGRCKTRKRRPTRCEFAIHPSSQCLFI